MFRLRGRTQEEIIDGLRLHRQGNGGDGEVSHITIDVSPKQEEIPEDELPPEQQTFTIDNETMGKFWHSDDDLNDFEIHVDPPEIQLPIFRRLGEPDAAGHYSMEELLGNSYMGSLTGLANYRLHGR